MVAGAVDMTLAWLQGVAALSVNWGAWAGSGMAEKAGIERMERLGFGALQPAAGNPSLFHVIVASSWCALHVTAPCHLSLNPMHGNGPSKRTGG